MMFNNMREALCDQFCDGFRRVRQRAFIRAHETDLAAQFWVYYPGREDEPLSYLRGNAGAGQYGETSAAQRDSFAYRN